MSAQASSVKPTKAPSGALIKNTMILLNSEEREALDRIAQREARSVSAMGRIFIVNAIRQYQSSQQQ